MKKALIFWFAILDLCLVAATHYVSVPYYANEGIQMLFSFTGPTLALFSCYILWKRSDPIRFKLVRYWGAFTTIHLFTVLQLTNTAYQHEMMRTDGTGNWATVSIPNTILAPSLFIGGFIIGLITDLIRKKRSNNELERTS